MAEAADFPGTPPSPARRRLRRVLALVTGAPLLAGACLLPAQGSAQAAPKASPVQASGSRTVAVSLDSLAPSAPTDGDTLTVSGTVVNNGRQPVTDAHLALRVGASMSSRTAIETAARTTGYQPGTDGMEIPGSYEEKFTRLAPGVAQRFTLSLPVSKLHLGSSGVYQLGVSLSGQTPVAPYEQVLGIERTFLPWQPDEADTRTKTTYLWPLISSVHLAAETASNEQQTPVFHDDDLLKEISPGGRLNQMVSLGKDLDVTWVIDPALLGAVDAMADGYEVEGADGTPLPGRGQNAAKQWLAALEDAVQDKEVVALPFADPDLASLAHNGKNVAGTLSHLKDATDVAAITVETVLHVTPDTDFAWPAEGALDPSIVKVATSAGADKVIARSDTFRESGSLTYTPGAARPVGGGTTAVVTDATLSTAFQKDMSHAGNSTLAVQKFLAQSLMIDLQDPGKQRSIVVAPQRMPTASQATTMAQALTALQQSTWSQAQGLSGAADAKADPAASTRVPAASAYPRSLRRKELPKSAFEDVESTHSQLNKFTTILTAPAKVATPFGRALDRGVSTSWRGRTAQAADYRDSVASSLGVLVQQVRLIEKSDASLSGRSATIPVTVQNRLLQGVDHLVLRLTSVNPTRMRINEGTFEEQRVTVAAGHSQSVKFTTSAKANGRASVVAQLYTEDGQAYGPAVTFDVKVNQLTPTVLLVIAGGVLLLVLAGFRMYTQRKRAAARQAEETGADSAGEDLNGDDPGAVDTEGTTGSTDDSTPAEGNAGRGSGHPEDTEGADGSADSGQDSGQPAAESGPGSGPDHAGEPAPDTASGNADRSATGERVDR
ncbi:hypothetical protein QFZ63_004086 [Streptomyces sp. B3I7]|uniref:DUF6049 family protein n=1 Tax=Streptomyces sp. B3I7 TaxID=3042269 RepID=UPI0027889AFA|nr:DUF6049 family protein [Streptomyces sp. B3I7]MDQ0812372.1 hypothetical protein [Streptomyces sp. B3I7]